MSQGQQNQAGGGVQATAGGAQTVGGIDPNQVAAIINRHVTQACTRALSQPHLMGAVPGQPVGAITPQQIGLIFQIIQAVGPAIQEVFQLVLQHTHPTPTPSPTPPNPGP